ncbi:hypothetical protein JK361_07995 [Streptomyces sp. 5-8]|uniref:Secreted protein n=1 Tax=Streptomyces musisoli TaxID=2802280 RepID=A0ABS1NWR1_9ACTN|nr:MULTISPECIES: hypothetical protein [Streptomyces]MBL1104538.1 hypothetical protein [Streptomyces musisoli]MBY8840511.1 hypothetical protein [Streptomyces sp. SP2-10]
MRKRRLFGLVPATTALVLGAVVAATTPAHAAENPLYTTGAKAFVHSYYQRVEVCDTKADGRRAMALATNLTTGAIVGWAEDKDGANGCTAGGGLGIDPFWSTPRRGDRISLEVWIQDGANGRQENFRSTEFSY